MVLTFLITGAIYIALGLVWTIYYFHQICIADIFTKTREELRQSEIAGLRKRADDSWWWTSPLMKIIVFSIIFLYATVGAAAIRELWGARPAWIPPRHPRKSPEA